jgi:ParB-like chromosome segregation protein Spo0J
MDVAVIKPLDTLLNELDELLGNEFADRAHIESKVSAVLSRHSPFVDQPIHHVIWVHIDRVSPNDYNPNSVARTEMKLLHTSIAHDGYTQPIVTIYDPEQDKYVIVDGFHRYYTMRVNKDIYDATNGYLPLVVLDKDINDRMASTVRHNRARGKHSIQGMSSMVFSMLDNGWADEEICNELGMEPEELLRLKHITGFSKLFKDVEYNRSWVTASQTRIAKKFAEEQAALAAAATE